MQHVVPGEHFPGYYAKTYERPPKRLLGKLAMPAHTAKYCSS